jgi:septal ring factor EnvC (AmiA/AmiB activator)
MKQPVHNINFWLLHFKVNTCLILFLLAMFCVSSSHSQTLNELKARKDKTKKEIEYINQLLNETGANTKASLNKLSMLNQQIELRNNLINDYSSQLTLLQKSIEDNLFVIEQLTNDLQKVRDQYSNMIRQAYRNKGSYSQLVFLLSSENFNQAYKRMLYIRQMARYRKKQSEQIEAIRTVLVLKTEELTNKKNEQVDVLNQQRAETSKLGLEKQKQSNYSRELQKREKELKNNLHEQQRIEERLQKEIERLVTLEVKKSKTTPTTPEEKTFSDNFEKNKGKFPWPTQTGVITDRFGEHSHPVMKNIIIKNDGIDITTNPGEKARSIFNGTVSRVFAIPGGNIAIILRHGEYITVYSNLKEVYVKQGDAVSTKQELGLIYTDKLDENKTILKFQIRKENLKENPEEWITR